MNWLRKHRYKIFLITVVGFIAGSFVGFGSYFFTKSPADAAIVVNGEKISYKRYRARFTQYMNNRQDKAPMTQERTAQMKQEAIQDLVRETVLLNEADKYHIRVTDNELANYIQSAPAFQKDGKFDQMAYLQVVTQVLRVPPDQFEEDRRRELRIQKLQLLLSNAVKVSPLDFQISVQQKLADAKPEERKKIQENPLAFREELRREQVSHVFNEWFGQIQNQIKVKVMLDQFEGRGEG